MGITAWKIFNVYGSSHGETGSSWEESSSVPLGPIDSLLIAFIKNCWKGVWTALIILCDFNSEHRLGDDSIKQTFTLTWCEFLIDQVVQRGNVKSLIYLHLHARTAERDVLLNLGSGNT